MPVRNLARPVSICSLLAVLGASAAFLAAGCGGHQRLTRSQYEQKVQAIYTDVRQAFSGTSTNVHSLAALAPRVRVAQRELRKAAEQLSKLKPPEEVEEQNNELAEGLKAYSDDLDRLREAALAGDAKRVRAYEESIAENESVKRVEEAAEKMKAKGYNLGPLTND